MQNKTIYILFAWMTFLVMSCSTGDDKIKSIKGGDLPDANGAIGELLLVVDTSHLNMELGNALEEVFLQPYPGLPQPEMPFSITRINYVAFKSLFQRHKTILFAIPFDDGESAGYLNRILGNDVVRKLKENKKEIHFKENAFAKNQQMVFLFGNTQEDVAKALLKYRGLITKRINDKEAERVSRKLYKVGEKSKLAEMLNEDLGYTLRIPRDFKLVEGTAKFTWLRLPIEEVDYNIIVSKMPYNSEAQFDSAYIAEWRNSLGTKVTAGDTSSIKVLQDVYPTDIRIIPEPNYMVEHRGLWKLKNNIMGGPFVSYVMASKDRQNIYYIEGFVAAPGKDKRELMREIETILKTFEG